MKPTLHRSITFWSGLLVMGFVCWAWRDSYSNDSRAGTNGYHIATLPGGVMAAVLPNSKARGMSRGAQAYKTLRAEALPPPLYFRGEGKEKPSHPLDFDPDKPPAIRELWYASLETSPLDEHRWFVPYWLILLAVAVPWSGLLVWRARWRRRA